MYLLYCFNVATTASRITGDTVVAVRWWTRALPNAELARQWKPILAKKSALPEVRE
jgi:hypothetical protein